MTSPNNKPNQSWTEMIAASRKEIPAPVDVRYGVRAALESMIRNPRPIEELDWVRALVKLFSPGFVRIGFAVAFLCMLVLAGTSTMTPNEVDSDYDDPLVTLYSDASEAEWSDWL